MAKVRGMPQNDLLKRYLDAGLAFTQMTRSRAEAIVKDLVKAGELQQKQAQKQVDDLLERSRKSTEQLLDVIRSEITSQLSSMGLATKDDIARLEAKIGASGPASAPGTTSPAKKAPAKKAIAKKAPAKKAAPSAVPAVPASPA